MPCVSTRRQAALRKVFRPTSNNPQIVILFPKVDCHGHVDGEWSRQVPPPLKYRAAAWLHTSLGVRHSQQGIELGNTSIGGGAEEAISSARDSLDLINNLSPGM